MLVKEATGSQSVGVLILVNRVYKKLSVLYFYSFLSELQSPPVWGLVSFWEQENLGMRAQLAGQAYLWWVGDELTLLEQNGRHFTDDMFKCIFTNENFCIFIQI